MNNKYKKCSCEWCNRNSNNTNEKFIKINGNWFCNKHYQQFKKGKNGLHKTTIVQEYGINDMPYGWRTQNEWNCKVFNKWRSMLERVYSEKLHEKNPTYYNTTLCLEWHWFSKFVDDFKNIDGYDEEKFLNGELVLDKDIKSNGKNKDYSLENCMLVSKSENSKQANKTMNRYHMKGNNNPNSKFIIARCDKFCNIIDINYQFEYVKMGFHSGNISSCCQHRRNYHGKDKNGNYYTWRYIKDISDNKIREYIIKNMQVEVIKYEYEK